MDEHRGDGSRREMEGAQGSLLPQESPSVLSGWVSPSLNPEAPGKGLVSGELTSGLIKGRWAQAARRHSSSITSTPSGGSLPPRSASPLWEGNFLPAQAHSQVQVHQDFGELTANLEGACSPCNLSGSGRETPRVSCTWPQGPATLGLLVAPQPRDPRSTSATPSPPSLS